MLEGAKCYGGKAGRGGWVLRGRGGCWVCNVASIYNLISSRRSFPFDVCLKMPAILLAEHVSTFTCANVCVQF